MATTITKKPAPMPKPMPKAGPVQLTAKPTPTADAAEPQETKPVKVQKVPKEYGAADGTSLDTPTDVVVKQAKATINKKFKDGSETDETIPVGEEKMFTKAHSTVGLSIALTKNLGNYESIKMSVSLFSPCGTSAEEIDAEYANVKGWVDSKINELNDEINSQSE